VSNTKKRVIFPQHEKTCEVEVGDNLLDVIRKAELPINADCGGVKQCGKCLVEINGQRRLACTSHITEDIEVVICDADTAEEYEILLDSHLEIPVATASQGSREFGIAIDIGTTTVVGKLLELGSGNSPASFAELNNQLSYGADVISRISASLDDAGELSRVITTQIDSAIKGMLKALDFDASLITRIVIAGNTTMTYLLLGLPCRSLGFAPFVPAYTYEKSYSYRDVFHTNTLDCECLILPFLSAYIGGDLSAGICALGNEDDYMLMDMGTNGELVFNHKGRIICTASAAGPAFEGGCIECGSGSVRGAITKVRKTPEDFALNTIGAAKPKSICGSGLLDLMAVLVSEGIVDISGCLDLDIESRRVDLTEEVYVSQMDIRQFQLAKSAVRSGFEILMREMGGVVPSKVFLAGGFGQNLDVASAVSVGLLPKNLAESTYSIGNSSLSGAVKICLNPSLMDPLVDLARNATEINLGGHELFQEQFLGNMSLE